MNQEEADQDVADEVSEEVDSKGNACITQSLRSLRSGDRRDRRLTGSMTVLTVLTVRVFC